MTIAIGIGVFLLVALGGLALGFVSRKAPAAWAAAGEPFGLEAAPGLKVKLSGTVDQMSVTAQVVGRGSGDLRRTYSQVRVEAGLPEDVWFDTKVDTDLFAHIAAKTIEEITLGEPEWDERTRLWGNEQTAGGLFSRKARTLILERMDDVRIRVEGGAVITERKGLVRESEPMRRSIQTALDVAKALRY